MINDTDAYQFLNKAQPVVEAAGLPSSPGSL